MLWIIGSLLKIERKIGAMTRELAILEDHTWQNAEKLLPSGEMSEICQPIQLTPVAHVLCLDVKEK